MDWNLGTAARTLWQEARNQPLVGQLAVAHSFVNRRNDGRWGNTLGSVCLARSQYSAWGPVIPKNLQMLADFRGSCAVGDDDPLLVKFAALIVQAENEPDPTGGATHYYNPKVMSAPDWVAGDPTHGVPAATFCGRFGDQLFYKNVR